MPEVLNGLRGRRKPAAPAVVININKRGEVFDPATYSVPYKGNEAVYDRLEEIFRAVASRRKVGA